MPKYSGIGLSLGLLSLLLASPACAMAPLQIKARPASELSSPVETKNELTKALYQSMNMVEEGSIVGIDIERVGKDLKGTYESLPKLDSKGYLSSSAARYLAHSFFRKEFGWIINGLEPAADPAKRKTMWADNGIPKAIPNNRHDVPSLLLTILDKKMHRMVLRGVMTFVGVLGNVILNEASDRLELAYLLNNFNSTNTVMLNEADLDIVLDSYMTLLSQQGNQPIDKVQHASDKAEVHRMWTDFPQLQTFSYDALRTMAFVMASQKNPFLERTYSFEEAKHVVTNMIRTYGKTRDIQCQELKEALIEMDPLATGRVQLGHFYAKRTVGPWSLIESRDYLRQLGALDETATEQGALVIISNYMNAVSNCESPSDYHSICCINECDQLLNHVENEIQAPTAPVSRVLEVVARMSSGTIEAPRNLSMPLISALEQAAAQSHGKVTLHSRLFAQWLHYAFPHECPYPYMSGRIRALTPAEYEKENRRQASATEDEIVEAIESYEHTSTQTVSVERSGTQEDLEAAATSASMSMWTFEDELVTLDSLKVIGNLRSQGTSVEQVAKGQRSVRKTLQFMAFLLGPIAFFMAIMRQRLSTMIHGIVRGKAEKLSGVMEGKMI